MRVAFVSVRYHAASVIKNSICQSSLGFLGGIKSDRTVLETSPVGRGYGFPFLRQKQNKPVN